MSATIRFAGSVGPTAKKIFPEIFSKGPAAPNGWPPARSLLDCTSMRTTSAESGLATRTNNDVALRTFTRAARISASLQAALPYTFSDYSSRLKHGARAFLERVEKSRTTQKPRNPQAKNAQGLSACSASSAFNVAFLDPQTGWPRVVLREPDANARGDVPHLPYPPDPTHATHPTYPTHPTDPTLLDGDHLQLDPGADVQRRNLHGGPRRRIGRKELAVDGVEFREVVEARDVSGHGRDVPEIHVGSPQDLAHVGERLARLGFDPAGHERVADRIAAKMAGQVQGAAGQDAGAEGKPRIRGLLGTKHSAAGRRLQRGLVTLQHGRRCDSKHQAGESSQRGGDTRTMTRHDDVPPFMWRTRCTGCIAIYTPQVEAVATIESASKIIA